jgi:Ca-activated chloride channel family protein
MVRLFVATMLACAVGGCAAAQTETAPRPLSAASAVAPASEPTTSAAPPSAVALVAAPAEAPPRRDPSAPWIGAAGASDLVLAGSEDTFLGVWVDVPAASRATHAPVALSLVVDTSGSMAGAKMDNARRAAKDLIDRLGDGDIVSITTFSDSAEERLPATRLDRASRARIDAAIAELVPDGGTNLFDGLRFGEARAAMAPATHPVRRVVVISDGRANVGPTSAEILGALAARGADQNGVQVTAIGVGLDYDETTLNTLAIRSSGRLYHLAEPAELAGILEQELALLQRTRATDAFIDVVPAPGVRVLGAEGVRASWQGGALRIPLGSMFEGQHREMLVRVRVDSTADGVRPLASVRFGFRDPSDGNLERLQEVVARYELSRDAGAVAARSNAKTQAMVAVQEAAAVRVAAAQELSAGDAEEAEQKLAVAEQSLRQKAERVADAKEKQRVLQAAEGVATARKGARAVAAAPAAAKPAKARAEALDMNSAGMKAMGY